MKKLILTAITIGLFLSLAFPASARQYATSGTILNDVTGTSLDDFALTSGSAVYTEAVNVTNNIGFASLLITEDKSGGAGDVDISIEYSEDGKNFYTAYTTNGSGTLTAEGLIVEGLQNVTRWIILPIRMAKFIRLKLDPDANSEVTVRFIYLKDI